MASIASHQSEINTKRELTPGAALRYAWYGYLILLATPFLMSLYVASSLLRARITARASARPARSSIAGSRTLPT